MGTVLEDVKKYVGLASENTEFDEDILMFTNGALSILTQAGVGPKTGMSADNTTTWESFSQETTVKNLLKQFVTIKVKLAFDPNSLSSFVLKSYEDMAQEALVRLNYYVDYTYWNITE